MIMADIFAMAIPQDTAQWLYEMIKEEVILADEFDMRLKIDNEGLKVWTSTLGRWALAEPIGRKRS